MIHAGIYRQLLIIIPVYSTINGTALLSLRVIWSSYRSIYKYERKNHVAILRVDTSEAVNVKFKAPQWIFRWYAGKKT